MTTHHYVLKQIRPNPHDLEQWWKLFYAAGRNDPRTFGSVIRAIAEQLSNTDLTRAEKVFLLRAWRLLVDNNDAFARLLSGYESLADTVQDPSLNYLAFKPELKKLIADGELAEVYAEAYDEAKGALQDNLAPTFDEAILEKLRRYGWNVDRKSAPAVLECVLHRLKAFEVVADMSSRYMADPEAYLIDQAASTRSNNDE